MKFTGQLLLHFASGYVGEGACAKVGYLKDY
jgi:hypothetical protein